MKALFLILSFIIPSLSLANGPAEFRLIGFLSNGTPYVDLTYAGYDREKEFGFSVYSDDGTPSFGNCYPYKQDNQYYVGCVRGNASKPYLVYEHNEANQDSQLSIQAKSLYLSYFKGDEDEHRSFGGYYLCILGCSKEHPQLLVEVNYGD